MVNSTVSGRKPKLLEGPLISQLTIVATSAQHHGLCPPLLLRVCT
jgi:hypothetical protein